MRSTLLFTVGAVFGTLVAGCASQSQSTPDYVPGFDPGPVPDGYTRFLTPTVRDIQPGDNVQYCQWVAPASEQAQDVLAFMGKQSPTGHHAVLYATTNTSFAVGESHICTVADMIPLSFIGGIGGEGMANTKLPDGLYFRLPAGQGLMVNSHWLNATDDVVDGQAAIDVKFAATDANRVTADLFANNGDTFMIPAGGTASSDTNCVLKSDLNFALVGNHMHTMGSSTYSELLRTDGTTTMLVNDNPWLAEEQFNPAFKSYTVDVPLAAHAGDTYHNHCEWQNTTSTDLMFPDEMCVGFGFYFPGHGQITCDDGDWTN